MRLLSLLFLPALSYQALAIAACWRQLLRKEPRTGFQPPISMLKPIRGVDPEMIAALVSQAAQHYPEFEILFGVACADDPAVPLIEQIRGRFPERHIELIVGADPGQNGKVGILANLARHARYGIFLVNDSDIRVGPEYLASVVGPLREPGTGVVTCLYRPRFYTAASAWEALGIAVDFMPSTLVAPLVGVREFGLGSTLCFRAADLEAIGGFPAIADYLADDYQLARRIVQLGKSAHLSKYVVETSLGDFTWSGVWKHQLRWARTIRASKGGGFAGLPVTHTGLWAAIALLFHLWPVAVLLAAVRVAAAYTSGWLVIGAAQSPLWSLAAPVWDLYAFAVWMASYASREVRWRDKRLKIGRDGRLEPIEEHHL